MNPARAMVGLAFGNSVIVHKANSQNFLPLRLGVNPGTDESERNFGFTNAGEGANAMNSSAFDETSIGEKAIDGEWIQDHLTARNT